MARAESLFREGKALLDRKQYDQACPMFAESARLDPSSGVELALGFCYEGQGKIASAWGAYSAAVSLARRDARHDREVAASERVKELEPAVSHVTFEVSAEAASTPGFELFQDGTLLASVSWVDSPVDPGVHTVEVRAPGRVTFTQAFTVHAGGDRVKVSIPPLAVAAAPVAPPVVLPAPPPVAAPPASAPPAGTPWRTVGFAAMGAGAASVIVGGVLGGAAISKANTVHQACPASPCSDHAAVSENQTAGTFADASTGLVIAGAALAAGGLLVVLFAPRHASDSGAHARAVTLQPSVAPGYVGLGGAF